MSYLVCAWIYTAGAMLAFHIASDVGAGNLPGKFIFVVFWPLIVPPLSIWAFVSAVIE
jgi:hypothetical protein